MPREAGGGGEEPHARWHGEGDGCGFSIPIG